MICARRVARYTFIFHCQSAHDKKVIGVMNQRKHLSSRRIKRTEESKRTTGGPLIRMEWSPPARLNHKNSSKHPDRKTMFVTTSSPIITYRTRRRRPFRLTSVPPNVLLVAATLLISIEASSADLSTGAASVFLYRHNLSTRLNQTNLTHTGAGK